MTREIDSTIALLEEVCRALGAGWAVERDGERCESSWHWQLQGPEYGLFVTREKGRLRISFRAPDGLSQHARYETWPSINVGETRGAAAIAREIKRRLLPAASELYAKLVERQAKAVEYETGQWLILDTLADTLGVEHLDREHGFAQNVRWSSGATSRPYTNAWVTADGDNEATLKLSGVRLEMACAICRLLTGRGLN